MMAVKQKSRYVWLGWAALAFAAGYGVLKAVSATAYIQDAPAVATGGVVLVTALFARRGGGFLRGALAGLALGLVGSLGTFTAMMPSDKPVAPEAMAGAAGMAALTTIFCSTVAGAIFGALGRRRGE